MYNSSDTKKIAKNTAVLYIRMIFTMLITLYSSRVILQALGVSDFGLYNVVGGVVALLSFLRTSLTSSTQRFISYELGQKNEVQLKKVFSISLSTHALICFIIILFAETLGLWFLNNHIQIPDGRIHAANWIYQFSIISLCLSTITVPYNADVISHEKMTFYAIVTILESILKLVFAYLLFVFGFDRLILYGGLMMLINLLDLLMYYIYCRKYYFETKYEFCYDRELFNKIFSFSGWTIVGQLSVVGANQGTTILVNMFHSIVANAAMGIAQQVNTAIAGLTANFQTAFQPQLTKSYAAKDFVYVNNLICKTSKISFYLLFLVSLPVLINIDLILTIWLGNNVPLYTNQFCVLFIIASLFNAVSTPLWISIYATGKIKIYQIVVSLSFFSDIVIVYLLFSSFELSPVWSMIVKALINFIVVFVRIYFANREVEGFSTKGYVMSVVIPSMIVATLSIGISSLLFIFNVSSLIKLVSSVPIFIISCIIAYRIGFTEQEQKYLINMLKIKFLK